MGLEKRCRRRIIMDEAENILDAGDIDRILTRMAHQILDARRGAQRLALAGIQTRGVFIAQRLQEKIFGIEGRRIPAGTMDIALYRDDWTHMRHNPKVQSTDLPFAVDGREIILVDDVLFTGRTIRAAMDEIMDFGRPDRIDLAVLIDRGHRELPIQGNYVGRYVRTRRSETVNVQLQEHDGEDRVFIC